MAVIKIKKRKETANIENEPRPKRIRIKTKIKPENESKPKVNISLKKANNGDLSMSSGKGSRMKVKLNLKKSEEPEKVHKTPRLRLKPIRIPGEGYDSEASDVEDDPLIEEGIILRVLPDIQAEFLKNSIESGDYSGVSIKWKGQRHAIVNINEVSYGAVLVNLPTIIEVNKSVDRKNLMKSFDVAQMLLCIKVIENEEDVFTLNPPDSEDLISKHFDEYKEEINDYRKKILKGHNGGPLTDAESKYLEQIVPKSYDYKHGITPTLYNVRNRRFRRKMGLTEFDYAEEVVERLLKQDDQAEEITYELVDEDEVLRRSTSAVNLDHLADVHTDSQGPIEYADEEQAEEKEEDDLDLDAAFQSDGEEGKEGTMVKLEGANARDEGMLDETGDDVEQYSGEEEEEEDEEEDEEDEEGDVDDEREEEDNQGTEKQAVDEGRQHNELLKDELHELETTLQHAKLKSEKATNPLLKSRFIDSIKKLEKEVELKRKQLKLSDEILQKPDERITPLGDPEENARENEEEDDEEEDEEDEEEEEEDEEEEEEQQEEEVHNNNNGRINSSLNEPVGNRTDLEPELDQNDLDMMMLFGAEGDEGEE